MMCYLCTFFFFFFVFFFFFFFFFFFQTLFFEVTERIPFILSHNIRSRCSLIMHAQKFVELYPHRKITQKPPKMGISETESDIRWRITFITLQRNFTSTIAALVHYEELSTPKSAWTLTPKWGTSSSGILTPHCKIWDPLNISGTMRHRKLKFYTNLDRAKYSFQVWKCFGEGAWGGRSAPSVNLGHPSYLGN